MRAADLAATAALLASALNEREVGVFQDGRGDVDVFVEATSTGSTIHVAISWEDAEGFEAEERFELLVTRPDPAT